MSALANLILRTIIDPNYQTKGAVLTFEELDGNLKLLADCIEEAIGGNTAGILPYDNGTEYTAGQGLASFVTYQGNTWEYINPAPSTGNAPDINDNTYWELRSTGAFSHAQNTDTGTNSNDFAIGNGIAGTKSVTFLNGQAGANRPSLRWNETEGYFELRYSGGLVRKLIDVDDLRVSLTNYDPSPAGTANAITATFDPAITTKTDGLHLYFKVDSNNTGATTFNPDGLGASPIVRTDGSALQADDLKAGSIAELFFDGINFQLLGLSTGGGGGGGITEKQIQDSAFVYDEDSGIENAYSVVPSPAYVGHTSGQFFIFKAISANTGASTLDDGLDIAPIVRRDGTPLKAGDIPAGSMNIVIRDGGQWQLITSTSSDDVIPFVYSVNVGAGETISLPMLSGNDAFYDFVVNFGDNTGERSVDAYSDADRQHTYAAAGVYDITIKGLFDKIDFVDNPTSIVELKSFGQAKIGINSFLNCVNFTTISATDRPRFQGTSLNSCFRNTDLSVVDPSISTWDVSNITTMDSIFRDSNFNQNITGWNTSSLTNVSNMFYQATSFNNGGAAFSIDVSNVTTFNSMFYGASSFNQDVSGLDTSSATSLINMFYGASSFNQDISSFDVSNVTNMSDMFRNATAFNNGGVALNWTTSSLTLLTRTFFGASTFNQSLNSWNVSGVTSFDQTFSGCTAYNNGGVALNWTTTAATTMSSMFFSCSSFNQTISNFSTANVTSMVNMFNGASLFNQSLASFNTANVTSMFGMFRAATNFNQSLAGFNTSSVNNMSQMFLSATSFNQPLNTFNTANVTNMSSMFQTATSFNQDISSFNVTSLTNATSMFVGVTLSTANYDALLVGWEAQAVQNNVNFHGGNSKYTAAGAGGTARAALIADHSWVITDGGGI